MSGVNHRTGTPNPVPIKGPVLYLGVAESYVNYTASNPQAPRWTPAICFAIPLFELEKGSYAQNR